MRILHFVGRSGVATLAQVSRLFWGERPAARVAAARRLRKLHDHSFLETTVLALHETNRLTLTPLGAERVADRVRPGEVLRTRIRGTSPAADHLIATAEVWSCLALRLNGTTRMALRRFVTEAEIRRALGREPRALIPDGVALLGESGRSGVTFAIEVDLDHEPAEVFGRKARRYALHLGRAPLHGLPVDALLVYAPGVRRLTRLATVVAKTAAADATFFQDLERLEPGTVLERLASTSSLMGGPGRARPEVFSVYLLGNRAA